MVPISFQDWCIAVARHIQEDAGAHRWYLVGTQSCNTALIRSLPSTLRKVFSFDGTPERLLQSLPASTGIQNIALVISDPFAEDLPYLMSLLRGQFPAIRVVDRTSFSGEGGAPSGVRDENLTFVFQGPLVPSSNGVYGTEAAALSVRHWFPGAQIVLSTWKGARVAGDAFDRVVYSDDPGPLPPLKRFDSKPNNINRQIVSTRRGLEAVSTSHAVKMRTDAVVSGRRFWDFYRDALLTLPRSSFFGSRLLVLQYYTMSMRGIEQIPFHISDVFQVGATNDLLGLWRCPLMSWDDSIYFQSRRHRVSNKSLEAFVARFPVEQYVFGSRVFDLNGLDSDDLMSPEVIQQYRDFLTDELVMLDYLDSGLVIQKFESSFLGKKQPVNCVSEQEWRSLRGEGAAPALSMKQRIKIWNYRRLGI